MDFGILGPLEVTLDGARTALGGSKPRALLAALLLHRNHVVSTDRLVDLLWPLRPPADAVAGLRTYVSRLRPALGDVAGGPRLRFQAPGYRLLVADDELDASRFERLVARSRQDAEAGDDEGVVRVLDGALALWRGPVLADLDVDALDARAEVTRLEELKLAAIEQRARSLLHQGGGSGLTADLEALVSRFPQREGLTVLLMRCLYLAGRQAEALQVYQQLRRFLVDQLGVEPSEQTRRAHRQVLEQDPALLQVRTAPTTNLPRRGTSFVGRGEEVARVTAALRAASLVTITGVGGVGKSRVAEEVARRELARFPDGAWWCELATLADGTPVGHSVSAALRIRDRPGLTIEQTVIEYLRRRHLLLVLDNCEHVLNEAAGLARKLVTRCPGVVVLATSREVLAVDGEQVWPLPPLPMQEASRLFVDRARASRPDFTVDPAADVAVTEICRRLDGLPLAIELAAARMRVMSPAEVAARLGRAPLLDGGRRRDLPRHQSLTAAIDWSYRLLSEPEQRLFARCSVFTGDADLAAVHAVCGREGADEGETLDLIGALADKSLLTATHRPGGTRYRMLETLRAYGREQLPDDPALARRHARYYVAVAERAARGVQGPDERAWVERTGPDYDNLRTAFERVMLDRDVDLALRLAASLPEVSQIRIGYEAADWAERALALAQDLARTDHPQFPAAVGAAARGAWNRGDFTRARTLAALAEGRTPPPGTARTGYPADVLADVALYEGAVAEALRHHLGQVEQARADGDLLRLVWTLYYVAVCHAVRREPGAGRAAAEECFVVAESTANPTARSMGHYALGLVVKKSEPARALELFEQAAALAMSVGNFWWQGIALMEAAATRGVHGDERSAAGEFRHVLDHWDRVGDHTQQWLDLRYVVRLLTRLGADQDALALHHCLIASDKPSPLSPQRAAHLADGDGGPLHRAAADRGARLTLAEAVQLAQAALRRAG